MKYSLLLNQQEILETIRIGKYRVCMTTGNVTNSRGKVLTPFITNNRVWVRIYFNRKRKVIAVSRLLWMQEANSLIPDDFEIHHIDLDQTNNSWVNLLCVHKADHRKLHQMENNGDDIIPF